MERLKVKGLKSKINNILVGLLLSLSPLTLSLEPEASAAPAPDSFADLVDKLSPAVVNISTTQVSKGFDQLAAPAAPPTGGSGDYLNKPSTKPKSRNTTSLGSGFIIDPSGLIVTNSHVVAGGTDITVTLHDNTQFKAKLVGKDSKIDIAILKIAAGKKLPFVQFGDSDNAKVGDWVLAIGNPYGLGGSVSAGIISARARDINVGPFDDFIQTDAAINRGNSGGPMFDTNGNVIGINTAIFSPTGSNVGIGFALPSALAQPIIKQLVKYGKARRPWLGIKVQTLTKPIADSLGLKDTKGALVLDVNDGGPSEKAGLMEGDIITNFGNEVVTNMRRLPRIVAENKIGDKVAVQYVRGGKTYSTSVTLGELDSDEEDKKALEENPTPQSLMAKGDAKRIVGIEVVDVTPEVAKKFDLVPNKGLLVSAVNPQGGAAEQGLAAGALILKANNKNVNDVNQLEAEINLVRKLGRPSILLLVQAGDETRFIAVPVK